MFSRLRCRLFGHGHMEKVVLGIGRSRHYYRCQRCEEVVHRPPEREGE